VSMVRHRRVDVDGIDVFYREAGIRNSGKLKSDEGNCLPCAPQLTDFLESRLFPFGLAGRSLRCLCRKRKR
jgi:hypothetical protein